MCNNCGEIKNNNCGCRTKLDLKCTVYKGSTLEPLHVVDGMTGDEIVVIVNNYLKDLILELEPTVIENVGSGLKLYKGFSEERRHEIKTLLEGEGILLSEQGNTVEIKIDKDFIEQYLPDVDLSAKVDKTTTTVSGPDETFKYTYLFDAQNGTVRMLATDLGKNIGNSNLTLTSNRTLNQGSSTYTHNTNGKDYKILGLNNESNNLEFDKFLAQNVNGSLAWSDGRSMMIGLPNILTETQKLVWKTAMNGGWTTNTMSVAMINPLLVKNDGINYVTVYGANLNFNPTSFSIQIVDSTGTNVITTIDNAHVILSSPSELIFWHDFTGYPVGTYKLRFWNGVASLTTSVTLSVVNTLNSIIFTDNTWDKTTYSGVPNPTVAESNSTVSVTNSTVVTPLDNDGKVTFTATSKELCNMGDDFIITMALWNTANTNSAYKLFGGLCNDVVIVNSNNVIAGARCQDAYTLSSIPDNTDLVSTQSASNQIILYKRGSVLTTVVKGVNVGVYTSIVSTDSAIPVRLKMVYLNTLNDVNVANLQIQSAYKLN